MKKLIFFMIIMHSFLSCEEKAINFSDLTTQLALEIAELKKEKNHLETENKSLKTVNQTIFKQGFKEGMVRGFVGGCGIAFAITSLCTMVGTYLYCKKIFPQIIYIYKNSNGAYLK